MKVQSEFPVVVNKRYKYVREYQILDCFASPSCQLIGREFPWPGDRKHSANCKQTGICTRKQRSARSIHKRTREIITLNSKSWRVKHPVQNSFRKVFLASRKPFSKMKEGGERGKNYNACDEIQFHIFIPFTCSFYVHMYTTIRNWTLGLDQMVKMTNLQFYVYILLIYNI